MLPYSDHGTQLRLLYWCFMFAGWLLVFIQKQTKLKYSLLDSLWPLYPVILIAQWVNENTIYLTKGHRRAVHTAQGKATIGVTFDIVWCTWMFFSAIRRGDYAKRVKGIVQSVANWRLPQIDTLLRLDTLKGVAQNMLSATYVLGAQLAMHYLLSRPLLTLIQYPGDISRNKAILASDTWLYSEVVFVALMLVMLALHIIVGQQEHEFNQRKRENRLTPAETAVGFLHTGFWRYSRYPNIACLIGFWFSFTAFCCVTTNTDPSELSNIYMLAGLALLLASMLAIIGRADPALKSMYPMYGSYMEHTSSIIPWRPWRTWPGAQPAGDGYTQV